MYFQDAVQTLIDAVQELIQTHEAWTQEGEDPRKKPDEAKSVSKPTSLASTSLPGSTEPVEDSVDVPEVGEQQQGLSEEVWSSLRREYPGAEFVVVTDQ